MCIAMQIFVELHAFPLLETKAPIDESNVDIDI